jgi:hypothetical protein
VRKPRLANSRHVSAENNPELAEICGTDAIAPLENDCGFIFIAVPSEFVGQRVDGLKNFIELSKYETKLTRHVGVSFAKEGSDYLIDWALLESPWQHDPELEAMLLRDNPFRPLKQVHMERYKFN